MIRLDFSESECDVGYLDRQQILPDPAVELAAIGA